MNEGLVIVLRRPKSAYAAVQLALHGLDPNATYECVSDRTGQKTMRKGAQMMSNLDISLPTPRSYEIIHYKKL